VDGSEMARRIFTLQIEIDCAASAGHRAPKITSGGPSRSDVRGTRRKIVRGSSYNQSSAAIALVVEALRYRN